MPLAAGEAIGTQNGTLCPGTDPTLGVIDARCFPPGVYFDIRRYSLIFCCETAHLPLNAPMNISSTAR